MKQYSIMIVNFLSKNSARAQYEIKGVSIFEYGEVIKL